MSFPADTKVEAGLPTYSTSDLPEATFDLQGEDRRRCRRKRRFFHLTVLSLVALWFLVPKHCHKKNKFLSHDPHFPIPPNVRLHECVTWEEAEGDDFPLFAAGNLTLDSASDLVFLSGGSFSFGNFELAQAKDHNDGRVDIQLSVGYRHPRSLEFMKVCRITQGNSQGVGIFTPEWRHKHDHHHGHRSYDPQFNVHVSLPAGGKKEPLAVESLVARLPLFQQSVADLGHSVYFDNLVLGGVNGLIDVESVNGKDVSVSTINAAITGSFKADNSLSLETVKADITAEIEINHTGDSNHVTTSGFRSTTGDIDVKAKLKASGEKAAAKLSLYAHTVKGRVDVDVQESPLNARATIEADTVAGNIKVRMPPTFEGEFNLETLVGGETVNAAPEVEDPSGRGRRREFTISHPRWKTVEGSILWSEEGKKIGGSVLLKSTTGSISLEL